MRAVSSSRAVRLRAAVRRAPRALYEELWAEPADRVPRMGEPDAPVWRPVFLVLLVFAAAIFAVPRAYELSTDPVTGVSGWAVLAALAQSVALLAGMIRPVGAWWAATALSVATVLATESAMSPDRLFPWSVMGMVFQGGALFLLALRVPLRRATGALALTLLAGMALTLHQTQRHNLDLDRSAPVFVVALVLGTALRSLRLARKDLVVQAELTTEERARRALLEERNRIARELHDVVAHHMSVISIQAQVAPHLVEHPTDELRENLTGIRQNALEALAELRRVLGVLRSEDAPAQSTRHAPQPGLDRLGELVATVRSAGLAVTVSTTGEPRPLPPGVELSAYRIVQEALSNVMRHAPGASAEVVIGHRPTGLTVQVVNSPPEHPSAPSPGVRHGLLGMRERAAMLGGELATGPTPEGGWEVTAILPTSTQTTRTTEEAR
ncbi:sensor histidine kinase [Streptomyces sp. CAI-121]|uniref:sensor histidine kinase n=1 Tax=unclassified Streptomyces TaxID=2593676 RepID=UPI001587CDA2|nr:MULTISPECIES: sensor histidine kinase [unclassified Streptomyces]NUV71206.1 sensor histidine kinase [Streptomyces sp. CAI-121]NUW12130.1 sensor histidine kinase [Streptomyces sp. CAI-68]